MDNYTHIYTYACMHVCMFTHTYIYIHICIYIYTYMHAYLCACIFICPPMPIFCEAEDLPRESSPHDGLRRCSKTTAPLPQTRAEVPFFGFARLRLRNLIYAAMIT